MEKIKCAIAYAQSPYITITDVLQQKALEPETLVTTFCQGGLFLTTGCSKSIANENKRAPMIRMIIVAIFN